MAMGKWCYDKGYAARTLTLAFGKRKVIYMHRLIARTPDGLDTDHIDRSGLNNQRANLRHCTESQNQYNTSVPNNNTSGFKGVTWHRARQKWQAQIQANGEHIHLGLFKTAEAAAHAYDKAALRLHGNFANINNKGE